VSLTLFDNLDAIRSFAGPTTKPPSLLGKLARCLSGLMSGSAITRPRSKPEGCWQAGRVLIPVESADPASHRRGVLGTVRAGAEPWAALGPLGHVEGEHPLGVDPGIHDPGVQEGRPLRAVARHVDLKQRLPEPGLLGAANINQRGPAMHGDR
jgi:hypothetical protein